MCVVSSMYSSEQAVIISALGHGLFFFFPAHLSVPFGGKCSVIKMQTTVAQLRPQHGFYRIRLHPYTGTYLWSLGFRTLFLSFPTKKERKKEHNDCTPQSFIRVFV